MNEQKNNGRGIFYGVIGVATLVVAIVGATFAYFTATAGANNALTGNMATITFNLGVKKVTHVDETKGGMIPMSNNMVQAAVEGTDTNSDTKKETCVDNNGNAVCQVYKITTTNTGSASLFLDGYVSITGGSGSATDLVDYKAANSDFDLENAHKTTMRWAQVFCTGEEEDEITGCTTVGKTTTGATDTGIKGIDSVWDTIGAVDTVSGDVTTTYSHNLANIKHTMASVTTDGTISGNTYDIINRNYIRISDHDSTSNAYDREDDITSALVFNQYLDAAGGTVDEMTYYIVVWLSETGTNQTAGATPEGSQTANPAALNFFQGNVRFNSAQGSEVTATFSGYSAVPSDQL